MKIGTCHQMRLDQLCKGCWHAARSEYGPVRPWNHHHRCESMYRNFNAHWTCWTWPIFNCKLHLRCVQMWWHKKLPQLDEVSLVLFSNALPSRKACKNRFMLAPVQCPHHVLYVFFLSESTLRASQRQPLLQKCSSNTRASVTEV